MTKCIKYIATFSGTITERAARNGRSQFTSMATWCSLTELQEYFHYVDGDTKSGPTSRKRIEVKAVAMDKPQKTNLEGKNRRARRFVDLSAVLSFVAAGLSVKGYFDETWPFVELRNTISESCIYEDHCTRVTDTKPKSSIGPRKGS